MSVDFYDIISLSQLKAIEAALEPSIDSIYRIKCREYSIKYNTPLHIVMDLDPMLIFQTLYEDQYNPSIVETELEEILDILYKTKDPTYNRISQAETEALVDAVMNKELARASKKKKPTPQTIQEEIVKAASKPKSGGMSFGDLDKIETKAETNKAGFES